MPIHSAGILLFRRSSAGEVEVLLAHPGGPFFAHKDDGYWSIPKGEFDPAEEDTFAAARREFAEETGSELIAPQHYDLGSVEQRRGKIVHAFGVEGEFDPETLLSNEFRMEWPPHSGRLQSFPEVDRAEWFDLDTARVKISAAQAAFLYQLVESLES